MDKPNKTICLNMIVRNESDVISRCLNSIKHFIDYWIIVDTGSTDNTKELIANCLHDIEGQLFERQWVNFEHNRSEALRLAAGHCEYILIIDADEVLEFDDDFQWPQLTFDAYNIKTVLGSIVYYRMQLVRNGLPWSYQGLLHECIRCDTQITSADLARIRNVPHTDGARSKNPRKIKDDLTTIERAYQIDPQNTRTIFYLAQGYKDAKEWELATKYYRIRIDQGGWHEEVFWSYYEIAKISERTGRNWNETMQEYLMAFEYRPSRAEPIYRIARHYRLANQHPLAFLFASYGIEIKLPTDRLFIEQSIYDYWMMFEYSIASYHVGKTTVAICSNNDLLAIDILPNDVREQVSANQNLILSKRNHRFANPATIQVPIKFFALCDDLSGSCSNSIIEQGIPVVQIRSLHELETGELLVVACSDGRFQPNALHQILPAFCEFDICLYYGQYATKSGRGKARVIPSAQHIKEQYSAQGVYFVARLTEKILEVLKSSTTLPASKFLDEIIAECLIEKIRFDDEVLFETLD
jgi:glycosyltransferase involved in cell wall biosynthesis